MLFLQFFFIAFGLVTPTLSKTQENASGVSTTTYPDFYLLTQTQLDSICQESIVGNFDPFFQGWIVKSLLGKKFMKPTLVNNIIAKQVSDHTALLKAYLDSFIQKSNDLQKYSILHFNIQMHHLIGTISRKAGVLFEDPFANPTEAQQQIGESLVYFKDFVSGIQSEEIDLYSIDNYRHMFFNEYFGDKATIPPQLTTVLDGLKSQIVNLLFRILDIYADPSKTSPYHRLQPADKPLLQGFYDAFYPLIEFQKLREYVLQRTVGTDKIINDNHPFFVEEMFRQALHKSPMFDGLIEKDRYLTVYKPRIDLERFHGAAEHAMISWPVLKAFEKARYALLLDKSDPSREAKRGRKLVETFFNIYKVFVITRQTGVIRPEDPVELVPVMQKLFDWIVEGREFKAPEVTPQGELLDKFKDVKELLSRDDYKRFYMPMLVEICKMIPGCQLGKRDDKKDIVNQFLTLGDFGDLFKEEDLFDFPKDLKKELEKEATVLETKDFLNALNDEIDLNLMDPESLEDPLADTVDGFKRQEDEQPAELDKDTPESPRPSLDSPRTKRARKDQKELDGLQKKFNDNFKAKFIPESGELDPDKKVLLEKYLETVKQSGNTKKKNLSIALLIRFLMTLPTNKPQNAAVIDTIVNSEMTDFRISANYESLEGLRNFLSRTMIPSRGSLKSYQPVVADDQFTYSLDLVSLLMFSTLDKIMKVKSDSSLNSNEKTQLMDRLGKQYKRDEANIKRDQNNVSLRSNLIEMAYPASKRKSLTNPLVLEKMMGLRLLYAVRGFFDYYVVGEEDAKAVGIDYYRIYLQFYEFIGHLRRVIVNEVHNPDEFVLVKLNECLELTRKTQKFTSEFFGDSICKFSHRKYAEMLFYFKSYLIGNNKLTVPLDSKAPGSFNVHTRNFLVFSRSNSFFQRVLTQTCPENEGLPICVSKRFFDEVLVYLSSESVTKERLEHSLDQLEHKQSTATKINVINGLEAAYLFVQNSSPVVYSKFSLFFEFGLNPKSPLKGLVSFDDKDKDGLTEYLIRTYKKMTVTEDEHNLAKIIEAILYYTTTPNSNSKDTLESFLVYGGHFVPYFIKLFLQYTVRNEHFALFADLLIKHSISIELIKINDINDDQFYLNFVQRTKDISPTHLLTDGASLFRTALREKYSQLFQLCEDSTKDALMKSPLVAEEEDEDMLAMLLEMNAESEQQTVEAEDLHFKKDIEQGINQEIISKRVQLVMPAEATKEQIDEQINVIKSQIASEYSNLLGPGETIFERVDVIEEDTDEGVTAGLTTGKVQPDQVVIVQTVIDTEHPTQDSNRMITIGGHQVPQSQAEMIKQVVQENMKQIYDKFSQEVEVKKQDGKIRASSEDREVVTQRIEMTPTIAELNPPLDNLVIPIKASHKAVVKEEEDIHEHSVAETGQVNGKIGTVANKITLTNVRMGLGNIPIREQRSPRNQDRSREPSRDRTDKINLTDVRFGLGGFPIRNDRLERSNGDVRQRSVSPPQDRQRHQNIHVMENALGMKPRSKGKRSYPPEKTRVPYHVPQKSYKNKLF